MSSLLKVFAEKKVIVRPDWQEAQPIDQQPRGQKDEVDEEDVNVKAKDVHLDLAPHVHKDIYEGLEWLAEAEDDPKKRQYVHQPAQRAGMQFKADPGPHIQKPKQEREPAKPSNPIDPLKYGPGHLWDPRGTDDVVQDYPKDQMHPMAAKQRGQLKQTLDHISAGLEKHGTPQMKRAAEWLKKAADLPAERLPGELARVHDILHHAKRDLKHGPARVAKATGQEPSDAGEKTAQSQAVDDALLGMPTALKLASAVGKTTRPSSEKELWKTKMQMRPMGKDEPSHSGTKTVGFIPRKNPETGNYTKVTYPTGMEPPEKSKKGEKEPDVRRTAPKPPQVRKPQPVTAPAQVAPKKAPEVPASAPWRAAARALHPKDPRNRPVQVTKKGEPEKKESKTEEATMDGPLDHVMAV